MPRVGVSLRLAPKMACSKPGCARTRKLQRHHYKHEAMFLGVWSGVRRKERRWQEFVARYYQFLPQDVVRICDSHHAEIHAIYDQIIAEDLARTGQRLEQYTWAQAERLMNKLKAACKEWLKKKTPGISSTRYARIKKLSRKQAIEVAREKVAPRDLLHGAISETPKQE